MLHAGTIFLSSFLLFLVQPLIARLILPWFGGSAAVWTTCMLFFQALLLAGYAYAHLLNAKVRGKTPQLVIHGLLIALALAVLPIAPAESWKPAGDEEPVSHILLLLGASVGLPYFLLASTSPLVQAWFARARPGENPYRLFAVSNLASLVALLGYPFLVEPFFSARQQVSIWSWLFAAFAVLCAVAAWTAPMTHPQRESEKAASPIRASQVVLWLALAATGSVLLLAVTNHLTQNIASIPFLWVVPLSLYLITFILCFDHPRWYQRKLFLALVAALLPVMAWYGNSLDLWLAAPLYAAGLFACCMFCHGELYLLKPGPRYLTTFYLMISVGGALGALLVGVAAPNILPGYYELEITLIACALLLFSRTLKLRWWMAGGAFAMAAATATAAAYNLNTYLSDTRVVLRNFYGVVRTRDFPNPAPFRAVYHGSIQHGGQLLESAYRNLPITYFGPTSGYGRVFASLPEAPRRVGVVGLGAGVIAAYARRGDLFRFYEIDPQVAAVAMSEFTFLRDSPAQIEVALGDGRLSLEREPDQRFDLLALDAFSGDSIPMHLLTREAMATYVRHLKPDGVIVFQATNRFVDITPVVERLAAEFGFSAVLVSDTPETSYTRAVDYWLSDTDQIIVTRNAGLLAAEPINSAAEPLPLRPGFPVWTDDFYNLLRILK